jgi:hypothetical protein
MIGYPSKWVLFKVARNTPSGGPSEKTKLIAYGLWEKAGKPEGKADYFWAEAEKIVKAPPPETNYVCYICGMRAYYDGRCGDGPITMCGCGRGNAIPASEYTGRGWYG